jgi:GDP-mannose 6-dehydrogenase
MGRLIGSNRQYIEEVIPHIGSLLCNDMKQVVEGAEVVIVATKVDREKLAAMLRPDQIVIDLVNLDKARRPAVPGRYEGICW